MITPDGQSLADAACLAHRVLVRSGRFFIADNKYLMYFLFVDGDPVWTEPYQHGLVHEIISTDLEQGAFTVVTQQGSFSWLAQPYSCCLAQKLGGTAS